MLFYDFGNFIENAEDPYSVNFPACFIGIIINHPHGPVLCPAVSQHIPQQSPCGLTGADHQNPLATTDFHTVIFQVSIYDPVPAEQAE